MPTPEEVAALGDRLNPDTWVKVITVAKQARNAALRKGMIRSALHLHKWVKAAKAHRRVALALPRELVRPKGCISDEPHMTQKLPGDLNLLRYAGPVGTVAELDFEELEGRLGAWPKGMVPSERFLTELGQAEWPDESGEQVDPRAS